MNLFDRLKNKQKNIMEQPFSDKQKSDMKDLLNKNFGSKKKSKATAGEVIKDTAKKDVGRYFAKSKSKSKGGGASTGGSKPDSNTTASTATGGMKDKMRDIEGDKQSNKIRAEIEGQTGIKSREFTQKSGVTQGNEKPRTVKQSEVSKKAKVFTTKINKRRAKRIKDATGGKKTGSLRSGNLSFAGDRSGATKLAKADIDFKKGLKSAGGSGDIGFKAPGRKTKITKRITRASNLGLKDPFEIDTSKAARQNKKIFNVPKKLTTAAPKGEFGPGDTKGQANVKAMDAKAFKVTRPRDVKLPQSASNFDRIKKQYRADVSKTSSSTGRKITKLPAATGSVKGIPQKGSPLVKVKDTKPVSGTYSMKGTGEKEIVNLKQKVQSILKTRKDTTLDLDALKRAQTGIGAGGDYLTKDQRKKDFFASTGGSGGSGGSGGGGKKITGGFGGGGKGGGGGRFKGFASKAASKGKGFGKGLLKFAKNNKFATAAVVGAVGYYGYQAIKRKIDGPQLDPRKDFTKTGPIRYGSNAKSDADTKAKMKANKQKVGDKVRFSYSKGDPDRAKPVMTPSSYSKFKKNIYTVKDSSGKTIDVNKRIQNSAFTKQLTKASTKKNQSAKDFMRKYQKAAEFRGITT